MKLVIRNKTDYSTRDLRKMLLVGLRAHGISYCNRMTAAIARDIKAKQEGGTT